MRSIRTRKFSGATRFRRVRQRCSLPERLPLRSSFARLRRAPLPLLSNQKGQGFLEYVLVLMVVLGTIFVLARPVIARLQDNLQKGLKGGIFKEDPTGSNFYYFPVK